MLNSTPSSHHLLDQVFANFEIMEEVLNILKRSKSGEISSQQALAELRLLMSLKQTHAEKTLVIKSDPKPS